MNTRELSFDILKKIEKDDVFVQEVLSDALRIHQFEDKRDRAFVSRLVEGVTERKLSLDFLIEKFSNSGGKKKELKLDIRIILRMGIYQIRYMEAVPDRAAISEAVSMAKEKGYAGLSGYVNGLLRSIARAKDEKKLDSYLMSRQETRYSTPEWICKLLADTYGKEKAKQILEDQFKEHDTVIRINLLKTDVKEYRKKLEEKGITVKDGEISKRSLRISGYDTIKRLPGYRDGLFVVQDETSTYAVERAGIKPGDRVLDICSAPGGKSMLAYELATDGTKAGIIVSRDISDSKCDKIVENAERLGIPVRRLEDNMYDKIADEETEYDEKAAIETKHNERDNAETENRYLPGINVEVKDAVLSTYEAENNLHEEISDNTFEEKFDVVLSDVPCSGLGIIGRKNDIKYHVTPEGIKSLSEQGLTILKNAATYVKAGGRLCYSTCTIVPAENEKVVEAFLASEAGQEFTLLESHTFLQGVESSDGFYYAVLAKN